MHKIKLEAPACRMADTLHTRASATSGHEFTETGLKKSFGEHTQLEIAHMHGTEGGIVSVLVICDKNGEFLRPSLMPPELLFPESYLHIYNKGNFVTPSKNWDTSGWSVESHQAYLNGDNYFHSWSNSAGRFIFIDPIKYYLEFANQMIQNPGAQNNNYAEMISSYINARLEKRNNHPLVFYELCKIINEPNFCQCIKDIAGDFIMHSFELNELISNLVSIVDENKYERDIAGSLFEPIIQALISFQADETKITEFVANLLDLYPEDSAGFEILMNLILHRLSESNNINLAKRIIRIFNEKLSEGFMDNITQWYSFLTPLIQLN